LFSRNGLEFRFESIADAIQKKRNEMDMIVKEFENKLKMKEVEILLTFFPNLVFNYSPILIV
jgi:hypothetical protein